MPQRIARFLALPAPERALLLRALLSLPVTALALKVRGAGYLRKAPPTAAQAGLSPQRVAELVALAARRGFVRGNCLSQSLTLRRLLRHEGHDAQLRIGARRGPTGLEAHAWVEHDGRPLNDTVDVAERFVPFPTPTAALPRLV